MSLTPQDLQAIKAMFTEQGQAIQQVHKELLSELDRRTRNTIDEVYHKHPTREELNEVLTRLEDVESELDTLKGKIAIT
jgi:hypothetical protein